MSKNLIATLDYPPKRGGVAQYLHAIKSSFPDAFDVLFWREHTPRYLMLLYELYHASKPYRSVWISHITPVGTAAFVLKWFTKKPYVLFLHGMDYDLARRNPVRAALAKLIIKHADHTVCNSQSLADEVFTFAGVAPSVVYPSVSDALLVAADQVAGRHDHFQANPVHLLTVGRLVARKGHEKVLRVLAQLPNLTYDIIGDGPERAHLLERISTLGLESRVRIYSQVDDSDLPSFYASADLFVMPTTKTKKDREGFGTVYLEAQAFGVPVVATNHPGVDEAVLDKETGLLVLDTDESLQAAIDQLAHDPGRRVEMGKAGRERVLRLFTRASQMRSIEKIL